MRHIKELLVVEGKHDEARLTKLFDCDVICTNGLGLDQKTLEIIRQASEKQGAIVLTDPDHPGVKIRDAIMAYAPKCRQIFIDKKDAIGKRNVGIEYVDDDKLIAALEQSVSFKQRDQKITVEQYQKLGLSGNKAKRDYVTSRLHLGQCNNKRLLRYLNMLDIDLKQVEEIADSYDR